MLWIICVIDWFIELILVTFLVLDSNMTWHHGRVETCYQSRMLPLSLPNLPTPTTSTQLSHRSFYRRCVLEQIGNVDDSYNFGVWAPSRLQTPAFRCIPARIVKDDDENLVRNIAERTQTLLAVADRVWPLVCDKANFVSGPYGALLSSLEGPIWPYMALHSPIKGHI